jgi:hypothetical protein
MSKHIRGTVRRARRTVGVALTLGLAGALSACGDLMEVNLPAQLTDDVLNDPKGAGVLVNSFIAHFEDAWDFQVYRSLGHEDGGEVYLCGPMCNVSEYTTNNEHFYPMSKSLSLANHLYGKLEKDWTATDVPLRARYMALASLYSGAVLGWMGSTLCETAINGGKLMTPAETLTQADARLTRALAEIQTAGDFPVQNGIATSARTMAYGLRAQVRWMKGDFPGARTDAEQVPQGFVAFATREPGPIRQNRGWTSGTGGGFFEVYDPIDFWTGPPNPVTGRAWPAVIPFTGYTYLGILPDGRAVGEDGIPIRWRIGPAPFNSRHGVTAGAVADPRVRHVTAQIQGKQAPGESPGRYTEEGSDEPIVNWKEMVLIRAEIEGGQRAIDLVNQLRTFDRLPLVTYASPTNATQIKYMIIEERRRALFNEGRFFYTKLKNLDLLWFPRNVGGTRARQRTLLGGIRYTMSLTEYIANPNLSTADKATGCSTNERPVRPT